MCNFLKIKMQVIDCRLKTQEMSFYISLSFVLKRNEYSSHVNQTYIKRSFLSSSLIEIAAAKHKLGKEPK